MSTQQEQPKSAASAPPPQTAPPVEGWITRIARTALIPVLLHLERVLPQLLARAGGPNETIGQVLSGGLPASEAVRTHAVMLAAYDRFRAMTVPVEQPDGGAGEIALADQAALAFRAAAFADQHADVQTTMLPDVVAWVRTIAADPARTRSASALPWRRVKRGQVSEAGQLVGLVTEEYGDYFLAEQAKVVHESDPYIHPLTITRSALGVEAEDFAKRHGGKSVARFLGRMTEDVVGVEAVKEDAQGKAEVVHLRLLPTYAEQAERLYDLTSHVQRASVVPSTLQPLPAQPSRAVIDTFALDLLLTHPDFPVSFRSIAYYLIRQQILRLTELHPQA